MEKNFFFIEFLKFFSNLKKIINFKFYKKTEILKSKYALYLIL